MSSISKRKHETSTQESEIVQGSMHILEVPLSKELIGEQYHFGEFIFSEVPLETKDNPWREMAHNVFKKKPLLLDFPSEDQMRRPKL